MHHHHHRSHNHSQQCHKSHQIAKKTPVTIIGGFLGAGKTSLVNNILSQTTNQKVDVLVREYGRVSIDHQLIHLKEENIHIFPGVSMHHDPQLMLYGFLHDLHEKSNGIDHLIMESSGLDRAEYLVHLFFLGHLRKQYKLCNFITIIDAEYGHLNLDEYELAREQIAYADIILINKIDLADEKTIKSLEERVGKINSVAKIYRTTYGQIEVSKAFNYNLFDQLNNLNNSLKEEDEKSVDMKTLVLTENRPMDKEKVNDWLQNLFDIQGIKILRSKGFFNFSGCDYRYEFQAVRKTFHSKADRTWKEDEERKSVVVLIGEGLSDSEEMQKSFSSCITAE